MGELQTHLCLIYVLICRVRTFPHKHHSAVSVSGRSHKLFVYTSITGELHYIRTTAECTASQPD